MLLVAATLSVAVCEVGCTPLVHVPYLRILTSGLSLYFCPSQSKSLREVRHGITSPAHCVKPCSWVRKDGSICISGQVRLSGSLGLSQGRCRGSCCLTAAKGTWNLGLDSTPGVSICIWDSKHNGILPVCEWHGKCVWIRLQVCAYFSC